MFKIGDTVRIRIIGVGYRKGKIVDTGLNSFWIEYNGNRYLVATKILAQWNERR